MKHNIVNVNVLHETQLGTDGWLSILGKTKDRATFVAAGLEVSGNIEKHMSSFAKGIIVTRMFRDTFDIIIFEYDLKGEVRDVLKLLEAVRRKLMRAISHMHQESEA
jgi:hypothetical protein